MKKNIFYCIILCCLIFLSSCSKDDNGLISSRVKIELLKSAYGQIEFDYNKDGLVKRITNNDPYGVSYSFSYDDAGRLIEQKNSNNPEYRTINITYEQNKIRTVLYEYFDESDFSLEEVVIDIVNPETYVAYEREIDWDTQTVLSENIYDISLQLDTQNRVVFYQRSRREGVQVITLEFEYTAGNLTKVTQNGNINNAREITYDKKFNYNGSISYFKTVDPLFTLPVSEFTKQHLSFIPQMYFFNNANNPVQIKDGETTVKMYAYEYNIFSLPKRMNWPDGGDGYFDLTYTSR